MQRENKALKDERESNGKNRHAIFLKDTWSALASRLQTSWGSAKLPTRLLLLTAIFVMLAEILIFVPSVANHRVQLLTQRLETAKLASLAAVAVPGGAIPDTLREELLKASGVKSVSWRRNGQRRLMLWSREPLSIAEHFDLRPMTAGMGTFSAFKHRIGLIADAMLAIMSNENRIIRVTGDLGELSADPQDFIEIVFEEERLTNALRKYGLNILILSILISLFTAALVYVALSSLLVRPMMVISHNMLRFRENPEDASRIIRPSSRADEIGIVQRELSEMQTELSQLLAQKNRLAQLGLAVSKISHDLRNMLANAQLISDRLSVVEDPTVKRFAPKLIASLDRAISFCSDSLRFGKVRETTPRRDIIQLSLLVDEVGESLGLPKEGVVDWRVDIDETLQVDADREHLFRTLNNLCRNAAEVIEGYGQGQTGFVQVGAWRENQTTYIDVSDNGPGVPPRAREHLFQAFQGSVRQGGTGLGLVIAHELMQAHGGNLELLESDVGAKFLITLPDRSALD